MSRQKRITSSGRKRSPTTAIGILAWRDTYDGGVGPSFAFGNTHSKTRRRPSTGFARDYFPRSNGTLPIVTLNRRHLAALLAANRFVGLLDQGFRTLEVFERNHSDLDIPGSIVADR